MRASAAILAVGCAIASGAPWRPLAAGADGPAQPGEAPGALLTTVTPSRLIELLRPAGYANGAPYPIGTEIKAIRLELNGTPVLVLFSNCEGEACGSFQYVVFFGPQPVDSAFINAYNRDRRFGRLYTDAQGGLVFTMDVQMVGGTSSDFLTGTGAVFASLLGELATYRP